jgi:hypothetical protein
MLPVEPGMTQLMGENVAPSGQRQSLPQINRLVVIIPNSVRVGVTTIHLSFRQLPNRNVIAEWKYDSCGNSVPHGHTLLISLPQTVLDDESPNGRNINNLRYFPCREIVPGCVALYVVGMLSRKLDRPCECWGRRCRSVLIRMLSCQTEETPNESHPR